jgi:DNA-binding transcriptional LysR family regulator
MTGIGWDHYRTFLEVARDGSLSGAARRLKLTQPTAGRHIDALEAALNLTLFTRSRRGLEPTAAALALLPHAEAMAAAHNALQREASADQQANAGVVRITASEIVSTEVLPDILRPLLQEHAGLVMELVSSNRVQNLLRRDCDVAVRMMQPDQDAVIAKRIGMTMIGLFAHRDYIDARGIPRSIDELFSHRLIGFDRDDLSYRAASAAIPGLRREAFGFRCDSDAVQLSAVRKGLGIGGCQKALAAAYPDLVPVLPKEVVFPLEVWVAMHEKARGVKRIHLVFDTICQGLKRYLARGS